MPPITVPLAGAAGISLLIEYIYAITTAKTIHRDLAHAERQDSVFAAQLIQSHKAVSEQYQKSQRDPEAGCKVIQGKGALGRDRLV
jgi:hypothetical protein